MTKTLRKRVMNEIYDKAELWELCWQYTDAYGEPGYVPPQGYDWSAFRDSSDAAVQQMADVLGIKETPPMMSILSKHLEETTTITKVIEEKLR